MAHGNDLVLGLVLLAVSEDGHQAVALRVCLAQLDSEMLLQGQGVLGRALCGHGYLPQAILINANLKGIMNMLVYKYDCHINYISYLHTRLVHHRTQGPAEAGSLDGNHLGLVLVLAL